MKLASVKRGDIVRVAESHAVVVTVERGRLECQWLGSHSVRWVRAREVEAHWALRRKR